MSIRKNISVVIQGPIDNRTYEAVDTYQDFGEVIVSTWDNEDISLLDKASGKYNLVLSSYDEGWQTKYNNHGYRYFQSTTTNAGAKKATKKYCLKTRSDELYPNLDRLINNLEFYPDRLHTTNNGFWKPESMHQMPACFSTHLFIVPTKELVVASELCLKYCKREKGFEYGDDQVTLRCTEQMYGMFFMLGRGVNIMEKGTWKKAFRDNVYITPCCELPGHLHSGCKNVENVKEYKHLMGTRMENYPEGRLDDHPIQQLYSHYCEIV